MDSKYIIPTIILSVSVIALIIILIIIVRRKKHAKKSWGEDYIRLIELEKKQKDSPKKHYEPQISDTEAANARDQIQNAIDAVQDSMRKSVLEEETAANESVAMLATDGESYVESVTEQEIQREMNPEVMMEDQKSRSIFTLFDEHVQTIKVIEVVLTSELSSIEAELLKSSVNDIITIDDRKFRIVKIK